MGAKLICYGRVGIAPPKGHFPLFGGVFDHASRAALPPIAVVMPPMPREMGLTREVALFPKPRTASKAVRVDDGPFRDARLDVDALCHGHVGASIPRLHRELKQTGAHTTREPALYAIQFANP